MKITDAKLLIILTISFVVMVGSLVVILATQKGISLNPIRGSGDGTAELHLNGPKSVGLNQPFTVLVEADTKGNDVNAVGVYLRFDATSLQLLSMDTTQSFCQLYPEKRYDQSLGTISLACGSPHPGFNGSNTLMKLEFLPTKLGISTITSEIKSQLIKSDGKGNSNLLKGYPHLEIGIQNTL